jgi:hypothetical protein
MAARTSNAATMIDTKKVIWNASFIVALFLALSRLSSIYSMSGILCRVYGKEKMDQGSVVFF